MSETKKRILIMGLPGAGKTTLASALAPFLNAVHFNADEVRSRINKDLGFSVEDRIEQARRMGWLCDQVVKAGGFAIADFICPTPETRAAFGDASIVWVDRIPEGRFPDTNKLFVPPAQYDVRVTADGTKEFWTERITHTLVPTFDPQRRTALFVGRWQRCTPTLFIQARSLGYSTACQRSRGPLFEQAQRPQDETAFPVQSHPKQAPGSKYKDEYARSL